MHNAIKVLSMSPAAMDDPIAAQGSHVRERTMPQSVRASRITALCLMMLATGALAQNTLTHGSSALFQGTTNQGAFATHADCLAAAQGRAINMRTSYQCRENLTVTPAAAPPPSTAPTVTLGASPSSVAPGAKSTLSWSSTNATGCTAGGSWSGTKASSGSEASSALTANSTFSLSCTGTGGTGNASTIVTVAAAGSMTGLDFPSNGQTTADVRLQFTGAALQPIYPATYIWKLYPRQQSGYHATMFWSTGGTNFWWDAGSPNTYYGAHPYPFNGQKRWEIAANAGDFHSEATTVTQWNRWYTQALRVWSDSSGKHHEFYWDLPDLSKVISRTEPTSYGNTQPPLPTLTWGDAPWIGDGSTWGRGAERLSGILRGIQTYSTPLTVSDMVAEVNAPLSTSAGATNVWYLNLNPTPSDISDKSGRGHHPAWAGTGRPLLWTQ
jgi:hypothetical protein